MKGNSERVPEKNFKDFCGKPLCLWILETLLNVERIEAVVINTDARERLKKAGVRSSDRVIIRDRDPELCGDLVPMNDIIADDLRAVRASHYLMTHTTNPLVTTATLNRAIDRYLSAVSLAEADSLFSVNRVQTRFYREDGSAVNHHPSQLLRTQDLEPWFEENSNIYLFSADSFEATNSRIGENAVMFEMEAVESVDIDTPADWELALAAANARFESGRSQ